MKIINIKLTSFLGLAILFMGLSSFELAKDAKELTVKSSVVCEMCKDKIEGELAYTKGVKVVKVDVDKNEIYVKYNEDKISELDIKKAINKLGYVADDMKPTKEAYDSLHGCCKAGGVCD